MSDRTLIRCIAVKCGRSTKGAKSKYCAICRARKRRELRASLAPEFRPDLLARRASDAAITAQIEATLARVKAQRKYARAMGRAG